VTDEIQEGKIDLYSSGGDSSGRYIVGNQTDIEFWIDLARGWMACERSTLELMKEHLPGLKLDV